MVKFSFINVTMVINVIMCECATGKTLQSQKNCKLNLVSWCIYNDQHLTWGEHTAHASRKIVKNISIQSRYLSLFT